MAIRATHAIAATDMTRAEGTAMFTVALLRIVHEMNLLARRFTTP